ncbi:MAG TPA: hypothetical protein P5524_01915 [Candidatus Paceibacterota bacterium]|nr:hypothetical protein [Candidatus Paceibacterota bacterium]
MKSKTTLLIIIAVIIVAALAVYFFVFYKPGQNAAPIAGATPTATANAEKVVCTDGPCIASHFYGCTSAEIAITDPNSTTTVTVSVLGTENDKCHFQMNVAGHGLDCLFAKENLNESVLNQVFGNEAGQSQVVSNSCQQF